MNNSNFLKFPIARTLVMKEAEILHAHTTLVIGYAELANQRTRLQQLGSGVLVKTKNLYGILTAQHVTAEINSFEGIALPISKGIGRYFISKKYFQIFALGRSSQDEIGPDLGFIRLMPRDVDIIRSHKVFCNLDLQVAYLDHYRPVNHEGIWYVCGAPHEHSSIEHGIDVFEFIHTYRTYSFEVRLGEVTHIGKFDFADVK